MNTSNTFNTFVNNKEATALKEMIFQRARERVSEMTENVESSYTTSTQNDIMDLARNSFVTDIKNPFSQIINDEYTKTQKKETEIKKEIGFPERRIEEKEHQTAIREKVNAESISQIRDIMMSSASAEFKSTNKGFMGALNFLNSQASVSLLKKQGKSFDITA